MGTYNYKQSLLKSVVDKICEWCEGDWYSIILRSLFILLTVVIVIPLSIIIDFIIATLTMGDPPNGIS